MTRGVAIGEGGKDGEEMVVVVVVVVGAAAAAVVVVVLWVTEWREWRCTR